MDREPLNPSRIRVLHIVQNLNYGGMERILSGLAAGLDSARFDVHVLVLKYFGRFAKELAGVVTLHIAPPLPRWTMLWPAPLRAMIRAIRPDVVHTHSGVWYKAALAARLAGVRFLVHTEHGRGMRDPRMARLLDGVASRLTDVTVAVSEELSSYLRRYVVHRGARVIWIPNGVDVGRFTPEPGDAVRSGAPIIGSVGRLEPVKGYDLMLRAFAIVDLGEAPAPTLVLAGDGSERQNLERLAASLGISDRVRFLGWHDQPEVLLRTFSLFTMSSRSEGTSVSLLEAMSCGCCPVVTDVGGNAAVLGAALRHRLVPPNDPRALATAWKSVLADPVAALRDGQMARERVKDHFSLEGMRSRYASLYEEHLPSGNRRRSGTVLEQ